MTLLRQLVVVTAIGLLTACMRAPNLAEERESLRAADREWGQSLEQDVDTFLSYLTPDATVHITGLPSLDTLEEIRREMSERTRAPGYASQWAASEVVVGDSGDLGYTVGAYKVTRNNPAGNPATETGRYVAIWRKHLGQWKISEIISNADAPLPAASLPHAIVDGRTLSWSTSSPAGMPPGARSAVMAGDPEKPGPVTVRVQFPAGYQLPPHRHPDDEHLTVLSGTIAVGLGETFDASALKDVPAGGYVVLPATQWHYVVSRTPATVQTSGMGPLGVSYANPADDPRHK
jgi:ketosteroid isomerase-like protein/quercetin dioxygenase-like cupin family protein